MCVKYGEMCKRRKNIHCLGGKTDLINMISNESFNVWSIMLRRMTRANHYCTVSCSQSRFKCAMITQEQGGISFQNKSTAKGVLGKLKVLSESISTKLQAKLVNKILTLKYT